MTRETQPVTEPTKPMLRRAVSAAAIGNAVEWFDYSIYAYGATTIARVLFPDGENSLFLVLVGFAVSFLIRPLGGMFWGPLGDRLGRRRVLAVTILLMTAATVAVGLVPSYERIGVVAPVVLYLLRMIQGFSTGGEYAGAATFIAEYAPDRRRGFWGSFLEVSSLAGFNLGACMMVTLTGLLSADQMMAWGWRVPFLVAGPLGLIGLYLRSKVDDTPRAAHELPAAAAEARRSRRRAERGQLHVARVHAGIPRGDDPADRHPVAVGTDHRAVRDDGVPAVRRGALRPGRQEDRLAGVVGRHHRARRTRVPADGVRLRQCHARFRRARLLYTPQLATTSATLLPTHVRYAGVSPRTT